MRAFLGQVGGRQIGDDAFARQGQPHAREGAAHPLAAFGHRLVAQAHDLKRDMAVGQHDLGLDAARLGALERYGGDSRGHDIPPMLRYRNCMMFATGIR